jgi:ABC-type multidrug transport system ATPase subunit
MMSLRSDQTYRGYMGDKEIVSSLSSPKSGINAEINKTSVEKPPTVHAWDKRYIPNTNPIKNLTAKNLTARYPSKNYPTVQDISFSLNCGEMMAIMGPSGSGKSSIIKVLLDKMVIDKGELSINGQACRKGLLPIKRHLGYVPQEDILDDSLTVYENLYLYQKLKTRSPQTDAETEMNIDKVLSIFHMQHKKDKRVVSRDTRLSGGQRKRINMAMEIINDPDVLILDEPTSGLSSSDSEHIISLLKDQTFKGKMVLLVIHQPSSVIYKMFDKVLILNKYGKGIYFGNPLDALDFFNQISSDPPATKAFVECPACKNVNPDMLLTAQEEKTEEFWQAVKQNDQDHSSQSSHNEIPSAYAPIPVHESLTIQDTLKQLPFQIKRQLLSKSRDQLNRLLSFIVPPLLGVLVACVFRFTPENKAYSIVTNAQYPHFLFLMVIIGMFLGLMASVFEILKDEPMLKRESLSEISVGGYFISKFLVLVLFGIIQSILFLAPAHMILGVKQMLLVNGGLMILITTIGIGFGLLFSTITPSVLAAYNLVPLILIPQIILGGGFLLYNQMGEALYGIERGCSVLLTNTETCAWPPNKDKAPVLARMLPASWAFEFLMTANYHFHPVRQLKDEKDAAINRTIPEKYKNLKAQDNLTNYEDQKRKEVDQVRESYNQRISTYEQTLNKEIDKNGPLIKRLQRGDFRAQQHSYLKDHDGNQLFDQIISKTCFLDGMVLLVYCLFLYVMGYFQVKRIMKRR